MLQTAHAARTDPFYKKSQASNPIPTITLLPIGLLAASAVSLAAALCAVSETVVCVSLRLAVWSALSPVADGSAPVAVSEDAEEAGMPPVKLLTLLTMDEVLFAASGTASMLQVVAASETESP